MIAFEEVEAAAKSYALVLDSAFSTNMLNTSGQVKVLLPDGTTKTYELNWDNSVKSWKDENNSALDTTEEAAEALKTFLGTDDGGGVGKTYPAAGAAAGNLVAYSINADDKMTIDLPELTVGDVVDATKKPNYTSGTSGFFAAGQEMLSADISKGDVEIKTNATGVGDPTGTFGIDADTIVYYYNGKDGSVAVGYDSMAKKIASAGTGNGGIDNSNVKVSIVDLYKSDVADVVVLYTTQAKFGDDDYVFVMPEFNVYNDYFYYTVIHEDGTMEEVKSEDNLRSVLSNTDGIVQTMDMDSKNLASFNNPAAGTVAKGYVKVTSSRYVNVYTDATTNNAIQNPGKDNEWLDMTKLQSPVRLANKNDELIYDIDNTDVDDETATGTTFQDGQYGYVVYDDDNVVKAAFIVKSYLTEDPTGNKPGKPSNDELKVKIFISGTNKYHFAFENAEDATVMDMEDLLVDSFEKLGYEVVKVYSSSQGITKVDVKRGSSETTFYNLGYTVTDEVQDVVVDTVGDTTVGPVAEDVKDNTDALKDGTAAGGIFENIKDVPGMKLTNMVITLPIDAGTDKVFIKQINSALETCAGDPDTHFTPTAFLIDGKYQKISTPDSSVNTSSTEFDLNLLVCDDGEPITLVVYMGASSMTYSNVAGNVSVTGETSSYTDTIDTTGVTFQ